MLGIEEGNAVGMDDGKLDGTDDGMIVGNFVGMFVGADDGLDVGRWSRHAHNLRTLTSSAGASQVVELPAQYARRPPSPVFEVKYGAFATVPAPFFEPPQVIVMLLSIQ